MTTRTARRYSEVLVEAMMRELQGWIEQSTDTLNNEESKDYPDDKRMDMLSARIDALQAAYDALEEIVD